MIAILLRYVMILLLLKELNAEFVQIQTQDSVVETFGQNFLIQENRFKMFTFLV